MALDYGSSGFSNPFGGMGFGSQGLIGALGVGAMVAEKLPGYAVIQSQFQRFNLDLSVVTTWMMIATALWTLWNLVTRNVYTALDTYYSCSIRITSEDGLFHDLFAWLREEKGADINDARTCDARKQLEFTDNLNNEQFGSPYIPPPVFTPGRQVSQVVYNPAPGTLYHIRHNGYSIKIIREAVHEPGALINPGQQPRETVKLRYYGRSPDVLKAVLDDVVRRSNLRDQGKTVVYQAQLGPHGNRWDRCMARPNRSISTVILEEDQKAKVVEDIEEYLLPATMKWYANRGLPYRRGYLLYGPPGTGKTSLSMALAGHFNLEVYALSLNAQNLTDDGLATMFTSLPNRCIILLEDVDASGVKRDNELSTPEPELPVINHNGRYNLDIPVSKKSRVSFSGLINAIDGAAAKEGRILIMTTNHRERLDDALIRPGRVDLQIGFSHASKSVIAGLFENLYDISEDGEEAASYMPADFPSKKEILELARQFSDMVPEGCFTPAEIQGLLLLHKKSPHGALAYTPAWVKRKLAVKEVKEAVKASVESS